MTKAHREHEFTGELRKMKDLAVNNPKAYDLIVDIQAKAFAAAAKVVRDTRPPPKARRIAQPTSKTG